MYKENIRHHRSCLAFVLVLAIAAMPGCLGQEPGLPGGEPSYQAAHPKTSDDERFARNLAARANSFCRCKPPVPPRFPHGEGNDEIEACVAQQAAQLLEESLTPFPITGPKPALDAAQMASLSAYLESKSVGPPKAEACDLRPWMEAVALAASHSVSSGRVANVPVMRADRRHPALWSEIGFMSASKRPDLTTQAEPALHYASDSIGSQVWVSTSTHQSGIEWFLISQVTAEDAEPDVCVAYRQRTHRFEVAYPTSAECIFEVTRDDPMARTEPVDITIPLNISYIYRTEAGVDVYAPDASNLVYNEQEALSLGFRPSWYKGVVMTFSENPRFFYTEDFPLHYDPQRGCEGLGRPAYSDSTPFQGLRRRTVAATYGVQCRRTRDACTECSKLTGLASSCLLQALGSH